MNKNAFLNGLHNKILKQNKSHHILYKYDDFSCF